MKYPKPQEKKRKEKKSANESILFSRKKGVRLLRGIFNPDDQINQAGDDIMEHLKNCRCEAVPACQPRLS